MRVLLLMMMIVVATIALRNAVAQNSNPVAPSFDPVPISVKALPARWRLMRPLPEKGHPTSGKEVLAFLREHESMNLFFVFAESPTALMNPQVSVAVKLSRKGAPKTTLTEMVAQGNGALVLPDYRIIREPSDATFNGTPAATVEYHYSETHGRGKYTMLRRSWLVPKGQLTFFIAVTVRADELEEVEKDLDVILRSITLGSADLSR